MSQRRISLSLTILSLVVLGGVGGLAFFTIAAFVSLLKTLQPAVAAAIIASSGTILVSVFTLLTTKSIERKNTIRQQIREKKIPIYEELIATSFKVLYAEKIEGEPLEEKEVVRLLVSATERLVIWGSDEVLLAYRAFRRYSTEHESGIQILILFEQLLFAIRKDLGHQNEGLGRGSVLALWINDIDRVMASESMNPRVTP
jgi:hypothetical protein